MEVGESVSLLTGHIVSGVGFQEGRLVLSLSRLDVVGSGWRSIICNVLYTITQAQHLVKLAG